MVLADDNDSDGYIPMREADEQPAVSLSFSLYSQFGYFNTNYAFCYPFQQY